MVHTDKYATRLFRKVHPDLSKSSFFKLLVKFAGEKLSDAVVLHPAGAISHHPVDDLQVIS